MNVKIDLAFEKDIKTLKNAKTLRQISYTIEGIRKATNIGAIKGIKKLKGYKNYYRIRIGDYRAGLIIDGKTVSLICFIHRKDIYKRFP